MPSPALAFFNRIDRLWRKRQRLVQQAATSLAAFAVAVLAALFLGRSPAEAQEAGNIRPVMACDALPALDLMPVGARIASAAVVTRNGHGFCDVKGYISPATQLEALLPQETWRGDYFQQGCGGLCGAAEVSLDDPSRARGYQGALCAAGQRRDGRRRGRSGLRGAKQRRRLVGARRLQAALLAPRFGARGRDHIAARSVMASEAKPSSSSKIERQPNAHRRPITDPALTRPHSA